MHIHCTSTKPVYQTNTRHRLTRMCGKTRSQCDSRRLSGSKLGSYIKLAICGPKFTKIKSACAEVILVCNAILRLMKSCHVGTEHSCKIVTQVFTAVKFQGHGPKVSFKPKLLCIHQFTSHGKYPKISVQFPPHTPTISAKIHRILANFQISISGWGCISKHQTFSMLSEILPAFSILTAEMLLKQ